MNLKKYLMKMRWRYMQSQTLWNLFYGTFVLGALYYEHIPFFKDQGTMGKVIFSLLILVIFFGAGYFYDKAFQLWKETQDIAVERNPFQLNKFGPKEQMISKLFTIPSLDVGLSNNIAYVHFLKKEGIDTKELEKKLRMYQRWILRYKKWVYSGEIK